MKCKYETLELELSYRTHRNPSQEIDWDSQIVKSSKPNFFSMQNKRKLS
jgi:hypothetical protein